MWCRFTVPTATLPNRRAAQRPPFIAQHAEVSGGDVRMPHHSTGDRRAGSVAVLRLEMGRLAATRSVQVKAVWRDCPRNGRYVPERATS
jgi:hypothetical protein